MEYPIIEPVSMAERQAPLYERYTTEPEAARITDYAICTSNTTPANQPLAGDVELTHSRDSRLRVGVHHAVGGDSDNPTPGDILCAALAACLDSTIRIIANRFGVELTALSVEVTGEVDVRGTLRASEDCPVAFQSFNTQVNVETPPEVDEKLMLQLVNAAEYSCVVLQTLRSMPSTPITTCVNGRVAAASSAMAG